METIKTIKTIKGLEKIDSQAYWLFWGIVSIVKKNYIVKNGSSEYETKFSNDAHFIRVTFKLKNKKNFDSIKNIIVYLNSIVVFDTLPNDNYLVSCPIFSEITFYNLSYLKNLKCEAIFKINDRPNLLPFYNDSEEIEKYYDENSIKTENELKLIIKKITCYC